MIKALDDLAERLDARGHHDLAAQLDRVAYVVGRRPALVKRTREDRARDAMKILTDELEEPGDPETVERLTDELDDVTDKLQRYGPDTKRARRQEPIDPVFRDILSDDNHVSRAETEGPTVAETNGRAAESLPLVPGELRGFVTWLHRLESAGTSPVKTTPPETEAQTIYRMLVARGREDWGIGTVERHPGEAWGWDSDAGNFILYPPTRRTEGWAVGYTSQTRRVWDDR